MLDAIGRHIERCFGPVTMVWHQLVSDLVHIDVHVVAPGPDRPYITLVTSGMSDRPMSVPPGSGASQYAELMICLPTGWPMTMEAFRDESAYWPIRALKTVARLPLEYDTFIAEWYSVPNGDPAQPYAPGTPFTGVLVAPVLHREPDARTIITSDGRRISLLAIIPLHQFEMDLKLTRGTDALIDAFDHAHVSELLDPTRPSCV